MTRFIHYAAALALCLGALSACGLKFGADWYDDYGQPGVSREDTIAVINQCRARVGLTGGAVANRNASARSARIEDCLRRRGFAKFGRRGPAGR